VPDERVALGGCLIDSPGGTLDGRLETQLQRLREVLVATRALEPDKTL
jgi:flagellar biosynthesis/type III secretory pathway protein FliH